MRNGSTYSYRLGGYPPPKPLQSHSSVHSCLANPFTSLSTPHAPLSTAPQGVSLRARGAAR